MGRDKTFKGLSFCSPIRTLNKVTGLNSTNAVSAQNLWGSAKKRPSENENVKRWTFLNLRFAFHCPVQSHILLINLNWNYEEWWIIRIFLSFICNFFLSQSITKEIKICFSLKLILPESTFRPISLSCSFLLPQMYDFCVYD